MKRLLEKLPQQKSIRALLLAALTTAGCTYNNYYYYGFGPDGGDAIADGSRADADAGITDGAVTDTIGDRSDTGTDATDAGRDSTADAGVDVSDAGRDADASSTDAGVRCRSVRFPGLRAPVHVGDRVTVDILTYDSLPARTYGINNVVAAGVSSESTMNPFLTPAITQTGTRSLSGYVIDSAGRRSDCAGSVTVTVE